MHESSPLFGQSVFITGGTGSFGSAFLARCLADGGRRVVIFSRDELKQAELRARVPDDRVRWIIGDVRDDEHDLTRAMWGCDLVVHAAAMKRIESCERNPEAAFRTNVVGTRNVAYAAIGAGVKRAIFLSTDKAPNPSTYYGMTKAIAERHWCVSNVYAAGKTTRLAAVRYGNVLGSRGSVLSLFRKQLESGEPVTVTDRRMTRFWLSLDQAIDLVLTAIRESRGGEVFVPNAGRAPVMRLVDALAQGRAYDVREVGLRADERLHEVLISEDEASRTHNAGSHYVIEPTERTWEVLPPRSGPVPAGFSLRSSDGPWLDVDELRRMVA